MQDGGTLLCFASKAGSVDIMRLLLEHGANADFQDKVTRGEGCEGVSVRGRSWFVFLVCVCRVNKTNFALGLEYGACLI